MKKRIIAAVALIFFALSAMTGCHQKSKVVTQEQAQIIAMEAVGVTAEQVTDAHIHVATENGIPCYNVHLSTTEGEFSALIHAGTGEVLDTGSGSNH